MSIERALAWAGVGLLFAVTGCPAPMNSTCDKLVALPGDDELSLVVMVKDEAGNPIGGATVAVGDMKVTTGDNGRADVKLPIGAAMAIVSAPDYLSEPLPLGGEPSVDVRLYARKGGARWAMHAAGDVMFGRRYEAPPEGTALIPQKGAAAGASAVVSKIAPAFRAADLRTVNLETVVSDRPDSDIYPKKRFILRSRPGALAAVKDLGVDVVILANNHQRDYLDGGIEDTKKNLAEASLKGIGALAGPDDRSEPVVTMVAGVRVAVTAFTTVDGSFVNDSYPREDEPPPTPLTDDQKWLYEERRWMFSAGDFMVPSEPRRVGTAWDIFKNREEMLMPATVDASFDSLTRVYPEVQDWVARRGHGGAMPWSEAESTATISTLASSNDVVVVQLHSGFQFQQAASENTQNAAHAAIDAGASLVVCHHPHVLQGFEWYKGKLIAYSLGNFVFDQDFLATFASAFLRTVWEGNKLLEARVVPVELVDYQPIAVTGAAARRTLYTLWERSVLGSATRRLADGSVRELAAKPVAEAKAAHLIVEGNTARIVPDAPAQATVSVKVEAGAIAQLPADGLFQGSLGLGGSGSDQIFVGRDLFGWGSFDDDLADGTLDPAAHWDVGTCATGAVNEGGGRGFLRLRRRGSNKDVALARPTARIPLPSHRLFSLDASGNEMGADPDAHYSVRLRARKTGDGAATLRVDWYVFDDADPAEDPSSETLGSQMLPLPVSSKGSDWQDIELSLEPPLMSGQRPNMMLLYVLLAPPSHGTASQMDVDDLAVIEWRQARAMPSRFGAFTHVKNVSGTAVTLAVPQLKASR